MLLTGDAEGRNQYGSLSSCLSKGAKVCRRGKGALSAKHITRNQRPGEGLKEVMQMTPDKRPHFGN